MTLLHRLDLRPAVRYALLTRLWQLGAGAVTLLVIARYFPPELQGFYYTFAGLLALQTFLELGFSVVITNVASHEWATLQMCPDGSVEGNLRALGRLGSLSRLVFRWFGVGTILYIVLIGSGGFLFLSASSRADVAWVRPWWALVLAGALQFWALPFSAFLEGCDQVATVQRHRLFHAVWGNLALWIAILLGAGLWAAAIWTFTGVLRELGMLVRYRRFFASFQRSDDAVMHWRTEIWPMQWRLAILGAMNYFLYALFTPVIFRYHGAVEAGRIGMTLQLVTTLQAATLAWISTRVAQFGALASRKAYGDLDREWARSTGIAMVMLAVGGLTMLGVLTLLPRYVPTFAQRLLPVAPTSLFLLAVLFGQMTHGFSTYLRAHKREALVLPGVAGALVTAVLVWWLGRAFGSIGAAWGYMLASGAVVLPWVAWRWATLRKAWQASALSSGSQ